MWFDVNCDAEGLGVICQDKAMEPAKGNIRSLVLLTDPQKKFIQDIDVTHNGTRYTIKPSRSGDFNEVKRLCEAEGQMLFEPRDEATWEAVYAKAREAGQTLIWLGIQQQKGEASDK